MSATAIPVAEPNLSRLEEEHVAKAVASGWVSGHGDYVAEFEEHIAASVNRRWAVATITGSAALRVMFALCDPEGSRVNIPTMSFIALPNAIRMSGGYVFPVDIGKDWGPDITRVGRLYADCAPAIGQDLSGVAAMCAISFNGNKTITTGQGGAIVGDDSELEADARHLVRVAKMPGDNYDFDRVGFNYGLSNVCAALGVAQMKRFDEIRHGKSRVLGIYRDAGLKLVQSEWMAILVCRSRTERAWLRQKLLAKAILTRPFWKPVHLQKPYQGTERKPGRHYPVAERLWERLLCLPCSSHLSPSTAEFVAAFVAKCMQERDDA